MQDHALAIEALTPEVLSKTSSPELSSDVWLFGQTAPSTTEAVLALHQHTDGFIALAKGDEDSLHPTTAIRADYFRDMFPPIQEQYLKDSYVSINAAGCTWPSESPYSGRPKHRINTLKYLNVVAADIDHHNLNLSSAEALWRIHQMEDMAAIPKYSWALRSGRGLWIFWKLRDNTGGPQEAREGLPLWNRVNRALIERLLVIGADRATHAARYCRLHGSLNTKSEDSVDSAGPTRTFRPYSARNGTPGITFISPGSVRTCRMSQRVVWSDGQRMAAEKRVTTGEVSRRRRATIQLSVCSCSPAGARAS
jgi:hypothetical protein